MKTKFNGFLTLILALVVQFSFAQEKTVTGNVSDSSGPLPGVTVIVKGTSIGSQTDFDDRRPANPRSRLLERRRTGGPRRSGRTRRPIATTCRAPRSHLTGDWNLAIGRAGRLATAVGKAARDREVGLELDRTRIRSL